MNHINEFNMKKENIVLLPSFKVKLTAIASNPALPLIVIADYDNTFTTAWVNDNKTASRSSFGVIDTSVNISAKYKTNAKALADKCRLYESDVSIDFDKRKEIMEHWYNEGLQLMVNERISKDLLNTMVLEAVNEKQVLFRKGTEDFFALLIKHSIPLIIISAGIKQVIEGEFKLFTKHYDALMQNGLLHIIANKFKFKDESVVDYAKPPILTFNKNQFINDEVASLHLSGDGSWTDRNIIFLGDHLNDIDAIKDLKYNTALAFAFYNDLQSDVPQGYCDKYDAIIKEDGDFLLVNEVIAKINK